MSMNLNGGSACSGEKALAISGVYRRFEALQNLKRQLDTLRTWAACSRNPDMRETVDWESHTNTILDEMLELSWAMSAKPAATHGDLISKASVLLEWCDEKDDDIVHALAASLCADLMNIARQEIADAQKIAG